MRVLVVDGQGGQLGCQIIRAVQSRFPELSLMAVGSNSIAASAMMKAGVRHAASGENPVVVACRRADVIIGPLGMVVADALYGEITPAMALAIAQADAVRILIPMNRCDNLVAGIGEQSMGALVEDALAKLEALVRSKNPEKE